MTARPIDRMITAWRAAGGNPSKNGESWSGLCPAHKDTIPSLSVTEASDQRLLVHCYAGCSTESVVQALGLMMSDLFPSKRCSKAIGHLIASYDYKNETDKLLYQVCRFEPKDFRQRRPDGHGGWVWNLNGTPRILYRLRELLNADRDDWVFVTEGERDADNVFALGLTATTNPCGALKWKHLSDDSALHRRHIAILPDRDNTGRRHAHDVATRLHEKSAEVKIVQLGGNVKDVTDWIEIERRTGRTNGELRKTLLNLVDKTATFDPTENALSDDITGKRELRDLLTDVGNAVRFVERVGRDFRYCAEFGKWLCWNGKNWSIDEGSLRALRAAKKVALSIFDEAKREEDSDKQASLSKWAARSQNVHRLLAMLDLARPELSVTPAELNRDDWLLNVENGTINLRTGRLRSHRREDLISKRTSIIFDPSATCPLWDKFLARIMDGNRDLIDFLQRLAGLALTGDIREQYLFIFHGEGANGKSVFLDTLSGLLGEYACQAPPDLLIKHRHQQHPTEIADLFGRRLVVAGETEEGGQLRVQLVKRLTGDAFLKGRYMRRDFFEFRRTHKLILVTNNKPVIPESTNAAWRRVFLVPFNVVIAPGDQDKKLLDKLREEWSGILRWAIQGCLAWQTEELRPPAEVLKATEDYRKEEDPLAEFLAERCVVNPGAFVTRESIFESYLEFTNRARETFPMSRKTFFAGLRKLPGVIAGKRSVNGVSTRGFNGIGLQAE